MFNHLWKKWGPNPLDRLLLRAKREKKHRFLIAWNRGLGDIPLGLYAMVWKTRSVIPDAEITFLTREDLEEGFKLLDNVHTVVAPHWKRGVVYDTKETLTSLGIDTSAFDIHLEKPDPTHWVRWQLGTLVPKLSWREEWDFFSRDLLPPGKYIAMQPQTETQYGYEKNWPISHWQELIEILTVERGLKVVLFGKQQDASFASANIIDLRGKTTILQMLSVIKNQISTLVVPDSGVLSLTYFLNHPFPLKMISLWADPRQGVLKQNVPSPNPLLSHAPLLAKNEELRTLSVGEVLQHVDPS